jgi:hypothetical protein
MLLTSELCPSLRFIPHFSGFHNRFRRWIEGGKKWIYVRQHESEHQEFWRTLPLKERKRSPCKPRCLPLIHVSYAVSLTFISRLAKSESEELFTENQAVSPSYDLAPLPFPLSSQQIVSYSVFLCVAGRATDGRGGAGDGQGAKS